MRMVIVPLIAFFALYVAVTVGDAPSTLQRTVSDRTDNKLTRQPSLDWTKEVDGTTCDGADVCLTASAALAQEIDGFGGSFQRSGALLLGLMSEGTQEGLLEALFDPISGAGLTLGKVPIGATDFGVPRWYTYEDVPGNFSIEYDVSGEGAVLPFVKRAQAATGGVPLWLQATMDYPPAYMMNTTDNPLPHPILNTSTYGDLARYYLNFTEAYLNEGVPIRYLSLFNEPYSSYVTPTPQQIIDLLVGHVGPLFRATPTAPNLTWGEQYGRMITYQTGPQIMDSPGVLDYVDILFYHGYDCGDNGGWYCAGADHRNTTCPHLDWAMGNITAYKTRYPNLKMWMTEVCYAIEFEDYPPNTTVCPPLPRLDFEDGMQWGRMLFGDMQAGASGWIYWNLLLNMSGGPYLYSPDHNDPWNNIQQPLVVVDPDTDAFHLTGCYYVLAHFGRFVKRGVYRVEHQRSSRLSSNVYVVAFANQSAQAGPQDVVVQWMNDGVSDLNVTVRWVSDDGAWTAVVPLSSVSMSTTTFTVVSSNQPNNGPPEGALGLANSIGIAAGVIVLTLLVAGVILKLRRRNIDAEYLPMEERT